MRTPGGIARTAHASAASPSGRAATLARGPSCFVSLAEGSELLGLLAAVRGGPVSRGCVEAGPWALVRYRSDGVPLGTLLAVREAGHWTHVAHGPRVLSVADVRLVSSIDEATAKRLVALERARLPE